MQEHELLPAFTAHVLSAARANNGKAPSERDLAEHFSVSRGQVREALAILESMQVIERRAKSGIYLADGHNGIAAMAFFARAGLPLENRQIYEAVEVRKIHEIKAAEMAAERATEKNFAALRDILARSEDRLAQGEGIDSLDQEFHLEIVRATQNGVFLSICTAFYEVGATRLQVYFRDPERNRKSHDEHRQIYEALLARDAALSSALMVSHLRGAMSYWTELLEPDADRPA
ncbi:FadR/GntR family transcriptional regulator [Chachezhania antarctica]|uniref:FadR/GntR family transcriptional regulator n=1 Tax=Chachezhania antarctica TaxID=2340860 RepID=UPI000EAEC94B|nr:FadR/GntR family transcriptional regulator [Chachezhania antarctica]|tara:strand:- start:1239 stop:1934 length:696 start_codon:yes stop_codon:yes gene_type:complete